MSLIIREKLCVNCEKSAPKIHHFFTVSFSPFTSSWIYLGCAKTSILTSVLSCIAFFERMILKKRKKQVHQMSKAQKWLPLRGYKKSQFPKVWLLWETRNQYRKIRTRNDTRLSWLASVFVVSVLAGSRSMAQHKCRSRLQRKGSKAQFSMAPLIQWNTTVAFSWKDRFLKSSETESLEQWSRG